MKKQKKVKKVPTSLFARSMSLAKLGLQAGTKASLSAMGNALASEKVKEIRKKAQTIEQMALLAKELGKLKGSLMKAGQMLSVYGEHFLPEEANALLKTLQNNSPPLEWEEIKKVLQQRLGKEKLALLEVEEESYASASLGQVHRAKIKKTGTLIAIKIQYPGVDKAIDGDIRTLRHVLSLMNWLPKIPATDELFLEIKSMLKQELNYSHEKEMLLEFHELLKNDPRYILPIPIEEFSGKKILSMSFENGVAVDSIEVKNLSQERRNALAEAALDLYLKELFLWRKIQTDPHIGNYKVRINTSKDQLVLLDYGAVREIPEDFCHKYTGMLKGLVLNERDEFERYAQSLGVLENSDPEELKKLFYELCSLIVEPFMKDSIYDWKHNDLPKRVSKITWEIFKKFPLRAPPREMVFLDRKMAGVFIFLSVLEAKINARQRLLPYLVNKHVP